MADRLCVVCQTSIDKNNDKNLVESRSSGNDAFNVKLELKSLPFHINVDRAKYICKRCLWAVKKRKGAIQKVRSVEDEISKLYVKTSICSRRELTFGNKNCRTISKSTTTSICQPEVQSIQDEMQSSSLNALVETPLEISPSVSGIFMLSPTNVMPSPFVTQTLLHSSTPEHSSRKRTHTDSHDPSSAECKLSNRCGNLRKCEGALYESSFQQKIDKSTQTVKHITNGNETGKCGVTVTINWPSSERSKQIPEDLHRVCKKLVRGRYDNLAAAVWKHDELRKHIIKLFLKELNRECEKICQIKEPSILRKTRKGDMLKFSYDEFEKEMEERTPLLRRVLMTAALRRTKKPEDDLFWQPAVCTAASICLKNRNPCLTAMQLLISDIIQHSSFSVRY